ncbi:hypothetical protein EYC80_004761 [Monilinia laxa]|uniref:Cytochrome c oxidase subunit 6, mitochondrial n=1 Tax=Monilinia laxa TaxID=61186 RepID=A0A5N6KI12_MONLA|nr:hypothetical protein EYC80_004761 [Monilinia laxa]
MRFIHFSPQQPIGYAEGLLETKQVGIRAPISVQTTKSRETSPHQLFLMSSTRILRIASRAQPSAIFRSNGLRSFTPRVAPTMSATSANCFSTTSRSLSADKDGQEAAHHEESFEEFTARYEKEFEQVQDVFELQRNLNNAFAYDLVPSPSVVLYGSLRVSRQRLRIVANTINIWRNLSHSVKN